MRIANLAPAIACGLSRPVTLLPLLPPVAELPVVLVVRGWGSILDPLFDVASELAGLRGGGSAVGMSTGRGGCIEARRLLLLVMLALLGLLLYAIGGAED